MLAKVSTATSFRSSGTLELAEVTRSRVKHFLRGMADRGIRAQTNTALSLTRRIYNWAIAEFEGELVATNVADGQERQEETARTRASFSRR